MSITSKNTNFAFAIPQQYNRLTHSRMTRIHLDTIDSTNNHAKRLLASGDTLPGISFIDTDDQTAGRGQQGNSWETQPGMNLTFTIVCHPTVVRPSRQFILSQCIALAIRNVLTRYTDGISIKWPNDIYWRDKKISGTLIECDLMGRSISNCIIGTGININQMQFFSDAPNPVSLRQITGVEYDRESLLAEFVDEFARLYEFIENDNVVEIVTPYMASLYRRDGFYPYQDKGGRFNARIADIEPTGHLVLHKDTGEDVRYEFKEVKFVI